MWQYFSLTTIFVHCPIVQTCKQPASWERSRPPNEQKNATAFPGEPLKRGQVTNPVRLMIIVNISLLCSNACRVWRTSSPTVLRPWPESSAAALYIPPHSTLRSSWPVGSVGWPGGNRRFGNDTTLLHFCYRKTHITVCRPPVVCPMLVHGIVSTGISQLRVKS